MHNSIAPRTGRRAGVLVSALAMAAAGLVLVDVQAAHAAQVALMPSQVDTSATRATGHHEFRADGVRVWTEGATATDKAAGYFDVGVDLADAGEPTLDWSSAGPARPGLQLTTDFDGDGDVDGTLVGEPVYNGNWWVGSVDDAAVFGGSHTPPAVGGGGGPLNGSLDQWRAAYPDARILQAGWSLGSGVKGDGIVYGLTVGDTEYVFADEPPASVTLYPSDVDTRETRATGHNDFRPTSGVRVWTEGATSTDKAAGYFAVDLPLRGVGEPDLAWRSNGANSVRPGLQLVVDIDGDGAADGILVGERVYPDGSKLYQEPNGLTNWWLSNGSSAAFKALAPSHSAGYGSDNNGTLAKWRAALPATATVLAAGWSLGSGVKGDGVIEAVSLGGTVYTFTGKNRVAQSAFTTVPTTAGSTVSFTLPATDPDGDVLTYQVDRGTVAGNKVTVQVPADFVGDLPVAYTTSDGNGGMSQGVVTLQVAKAASSVTLRVKPAKATTKKKVKVVVRIVSTGASTGGAVVIRSRGEVVGSGTVVGDKVKVKLDRKLAAGNRKLKVAYAGTAATQPAKAKVVVKVAR